MSKTNYGSFGELRETFPTVDKVGELMVFNIAGNNYRLMAAIHLGRHKAYIRYVLTHQDYDKGAWKL